MNRKDNYQQQEQQRERDGSDWLTSSSSSSHNKRTKLRSTYSGTGAWLQKPLSLASIGSSSSSSTSIHNNNHHDYQNNDNTTSYGTIPPNNNSPPPNKNLNRHLSLFDLVAIGLGATVGSGIFVLCGLIAHQYAGPATCLSWSIAGLAACLSGLSYAELAGRMPSAGSAYSYVYVSMGELPAWIVACCLNMEYLAAAAAVARSWGDKMFDYLSTELGVEEDGDDSRRNVWYLEPVGTMNIFACVVSTASVALLLSGVKESKATTNFFTITKLSLVLFMIIGGFILTKTQNLIPFLPVQFGMTGVFRGATSSFFGYLGFDEVCCVAGEAKFPKRNLPYAIMLTLGGVTVIYVLAALGLTGMEPYERISDISGFPSAFRYNGVNWAAQLCAFGEVFTLPIVVLITIMAQPRLMYALSIDGLLPPRFSEVDSHGNLRFGLATAGGAMILISTFIPFTHLNDMISTAVLVAFSMTDSSLILLRVENPVGSSGGKNLGLVEMLLIGINLSSFVFGISTSHFIHMRLGQMVAIVSIMIVIGCIYALNTHCTKSLVFGGKNRALDTSSSSSSSEDDDDDGGYFEAPLVPTIPCLGIFVNWYLISQLELFGIGLLLSYLGLGALYYFGYGRYHSVGNNGGWDHYHPNNNHRGMLGEEEEGGEGKDLSTTTISSSSSSSGDVVVAEEDQPQQQQQRGEGENDLLLGSI